MKRDRRHLPRHFIRGGAAIEFMFCLPLLLLLLIPVVDFARVIQANMIITNLSREGANLASRTAMNPQELMDALAATAQPLDMRANGMIHITRILASRKNGVSSNAVIGQVRWNGGTHAPSAGAWSCGGAGTYWDAEGNCAGFPPLSGAPETDVLSGSLNDGDVVYQVEVFYRFPLLFGSLDLGDFRLPALNPDLYAMTVF
ncbi:TadE/TadG family type IV pilus assembly protein [Noviherbaspirillum aerium]|uniref:TadE/TadG family type IV pilus assembly protein n=1 Tax=Noviherbaspirillum aerium TaxID=2588497 RepID=UPI00124EDFB0|nr:TadE/TadG family type IV pilus assembly protein [Noviherbaspirillum aerium]